MVKKAKDGINPIGFCGHHCDYCFLGQWCGGCRSGYNCCYECENIDNCETGYYGKKDEYVAKATALFIKKYGEECYSKTLKQAINAGENYPKTFDAVGSINGALELMEKYIKVLLQIIQQQRQILTEVLPFCYLSGNYRNFS